MSVMEHMCVLFIWLIAKFIEAIPRPTTVLIAACIVLATVSIVTVAKIVRGRFRRAEVRQ